MQLCARLSTQGSKSDACINKSDFVSIVQSSHHREIVQKYYVCSTELAMSAITINDLCHIRENCNCTAFTSYELCQLIEYFCLSLFLLFFLCRSYRPAGAVFVLSMF